MIASNYLSLHLERLKPAQEWTGKRGQLSFVLPKGGRGSYVAASVTHRLAAGDVLVTHANGALAGKIGVLDGSELVFWCFSVCLENLFPLFAGNEIGLLQSLTDSFQQAKRYPASSPLAEECHRLLDELPPRADVAQRSQLLRIAAAVLALEFKSAHQQRVGFVGAEEHLIQVFEHLSADEILNLSVSELATRFSCCRRHLSRLFHQNFGMSVTAMRMEMRLLKAVSLLRNPDTKIINVADDCGFKHLGLFNTCFKRRFGETPGQWRKLFQSASGPAGNAIKNERLCGLPAGGLCPLAAKPAADVSLPTKELPSRPTPEAPRAPFGNGRRRPGPGPDRAPKPLSPLGPVAGAIAPGTVRPETQRTVRAGTSHLRIRPQPLTQPAATVNLNPAGGSP